MIKVYYCPQCKREFYSTHLYENCKICDNRVYRLPALYEEFTSMDREERTVYIEKSIEEINKKEEQKAEKKRKQKEKALLKQE